MSYESRARIDNVEFLIQSYEIVRPDPMRGPNIGTYIERCQQREGPDLWKVARGRDNLNTDGEWEWEPNPSSRDDAFLARCRYRSPALALKVLLRRAIGEVVR